MEEVSNQKANAWEVQNLQNEPGKEKAPERHYNGVGRGNERGSRWTLWLVILLMVLLLASSLANLVVSHRAYESSRKEVILIEQLTQSVRDTQRLIMNLAKMLEQSSPEEEEAEEERGSVGDGSI